MSCTSAGTDRKNVTPLGESRSLRQIVIRHCDHCWYPLTDTKVGSRTLGHTYIVISIPIYIKTQRRKLYVFRLKKHRATCSMVHMFFLREKYRAFRYMLKKNLVRTAFWHCIEQILLCSMLCAYRKEGPNACEKRRDKCAKNAWHSIPKQISYSM